MSSRKKSKAARINGAKSKGPVTPEGRARSSQNALRHGLSSAVVVLPHEDRAQFEQLRDSYMESFQPADQPQHDLVETMAAARWRLNRLQEIEAKLFEKEMVLRANEMAKELNEMTEVEKLAWVFDTLANHRQIPSDADPLRRQPKPHLRARLQAVTATPEAGSTASSP